MRTTIIVLEKDLRIAWRDKAGWLSSLIFSAILIFIYAFAFDLAGTNSEPLLPGILWTTFLFSGIITCNQSFQQESVTGTLDAMIASPISQTSIFFGKFFCNLISLSIIQFMIIVLGTIMFQVNLINIEVILAIFLGTIGFVSLVTLLSAFEYRERFRAVLLPVIELPLLIPLLLAGVQASSSALEISNTSSPWLIFLGIFSLWGFLGSILLFPLVNEK
ncbi:MAG: heme exporter protein CcmB [Dehalococcoidia bacterium]